MVTNVLYSTPRRQPVSCVFRPRLFFFSHSPFSYRVVKYWVCDARVNHLRERYRGILSPGLTSHTSSRFNAICLVGQPHSSLSSSSSTTCRPFIYIVRQCHSSSATSSVHAIPRYRRIVVSRDRNVTYPGSPMRARRRARASFIRVIEHWMHSSDALVKVSRLCHISRWFGEIVRWNIKVSAFKLMLLFALNWFLFICI